MNFTVVSKTRKEDKKGISYKVQLKTENKDTLTLVVDEEAYNTYEQDDVIPVSLGVPQ